MFLFYDEILVDLGIFTDIGIFPWDKNGIFREDNDSSKDLERKLPEKMRIDWCSETIDEQAMQEWINEVSRLKCYEVLRDEDIVLHVVNILAPKNVLELMKTILYFNKS